MKVFLGGTCGGSNWRDVLIPRLEIDFFNPVVEEWTPACLEEELRQRQICDICLYVITPKMEGLYSIAEVVDDSNKRPDKTVYCFVEDEGIFGGDGEFGDHQLKGLKAVGAMVEGNGGTWVRDFEDLGQVLTT